MNIIICGRLCESDRRFTTKHVWVYISIETLVSCHQNREIRTKAEPMDSVSRLTTGFAESYDTLDTTILPRGTVKNKPWIYNSNDIFFVWMWLSLSGGATAPDNRYTYYLIFISTNWNDLRSAGCLHLVLRHPIFSPESVHHNSYFGGEQRLHTAQTVSVTDLDNSFIYFLIICLPRNLYTSCMSKKKNKPKRWLLFWMFLSVRAQSTWSQPQSR